MISLDTHLLNSSPKLLANIAGEGLKRLLRRCGIGGRIGRIGREYLE